jgi:DNA polymerase-3 subunit gamma/tau
MSTALYRKWRSQTFDELVGQEHVTRTLQNALRGERTTHAYLFTGPRGTGKTSTARILAKALNCAAPEGDRPCNQCARCIAVNEGRYIDLLEIDAASNNGVDDVRDLREKVGFRPADGPYRVYIIDEVHMLSKPAFNALLKTLEEPPDHVRFILATTEPHALPATVISRCQRFDFRRIPVPEIVSHLRHIVEAEGRSADDDALSAIARSAQGGMRDAISLLDQLLSAGDGAVTFAQVRAALGAVSTLSVIDFVDAIAKQAAADGLHILQGIGSSGGSLAEFNRQLVEHLRGLLLLQTARDPALLGELSLESQNAIQRQVKLLNPAQTVFAIKRFGAAQLELKSSTQPQLPLELALIETIQSLAAPAPAAASAAAPVAAPAPSSAAQPVGAGQPVAAGQQAHAPRQAPAGQLGERPAPPAAHSGQPASDSSRGAGAAAEPPVADEPDAPPVDTAAIERFRANLATFKNNIKKRCGPKVSAALNNVVDISIGGNQVAFAFGNNSFAREMIAEPEVMEVVIDELTRMLGSRVTLDCQVTAQAKLRASPGSSSAPRGTPDDLVQFAVDVLQAEVKNDE